MINSDDDNAAMTASSDNEEEEPHRNPAAEFISSVSTMMNNAIFARSGYSSSAENNVAVRTETTFDKSLATKHEYLGTDFEELSGRTLYDEGSIVWLPILLELGAVLFPGQTLPLTDFYPPTISIFRQVIHKDKTFGVVFLKEGGGLSARSGITAEIYQYHEETPNDGFKIKAQGRQRFKLLEKKRQAPGILSGKVLILPEIPLLSPLHSSRFTSLDRFRSSTTKKEKIFLMDATQTAWPSWVYRQYDPFHLVKEVTETLKNLKTGDLSTVPPSDFSDFSYWVAKFLPIDDTLKLKMLSFDTAVERLQYALRVILKRCRLFCSRCGNCVANRKDLFSMSTDGSHGMYCNPGGYVHGIVTLYSAQRITLDSNPPSAEYSWFPGYAWTIAHCRNCDCHLGWLFTAVKANLKPAKFWGLSWKSVTTQRKNM